MWTEFFIFGTIWFWILLGVTALIITSLIEVEFEKGDTNGRGATITLIAFTVIYYFMGSSEHIMNIIYFIRDNPFNILGYLAGYYAIGVAWSMVKWYFFLKFKAAEMLERLDKYSHLDYDKEDLTPSARSKKGTIIAWMSYWFFSMIWTLLHKFVREAFQFLYIKFESVYNRISTSVFADVNAKYTAKLAEKVAKANKPKL